MTKKSKQARAREFNTTSRQSIKERDQNQCIFCQMEYRMEEVEWTGQGTLSIMHYIPRSHGGLGIPQNGALGCISHHMMLDNAIRDIGKRCCRCLSATCRIITRIGRRMPWFTANGDSVHTKMYVQKEQK